MKKLLVILSLFAATPAAAGVSCSLPFNLQNNTVADATQVMANYNALLSCFSNAAASGVNSDITALTAISTPFTPTQGGTPVFVGGTSTGTANAQIVGATTPVSFSLTAGNQVTFYAGFTNTGPMTLNVAATGATNVYRRTQLGISATVGGELIAGHAVTAIYDGTEFQIVSIAPAQVGEIKDWAGTTAPPGWSFIDGSCVSRTTFADLFTVIGTVYDNGCGAGLFELPDGRGRMLAGRDNMGGTAANRITNAGSGCVGTTLGKTGCGAENQTLLQANLPNLNLGISGITINSLGLCVEGDTSHGCQVGGTNSVLTSNGGGGGNFGVTVASQGTAATGGSDSSFAMLNPLQIVNKIIKY